MQTTFLTSPRFSPFTLLFTLLVTVLLAGCTGSTPPPPTTEPSPDARVDTATDLIAALQAQGFVVEEAGMSEPFLLEKAAHLLQVNGQQVSVWEYKTVEEADGARLFLRGPNSPLALMDFIAAPRFYQNGSMIVLFVATDPAIVTALTTILGEPFL